MNLRLPLLLGIFLCFTLLAHDRDWRSRDPWRRLGISPSASLKPLEDVERAIRYEWRAVVRRGGSHAADLQKEYFAYSLALLDIREAFRHLEAENRRVARTEYFEFSHAVTRHSAYNQLEAYFRRGDSFAAALAAELDNYVQELTSPMDGTSATLNADHLAGYATCIFEHLSDFLNSGPSVREAVEAAANINSLISNAPFQAKGPGAELATLRDNLLLLAQGLVINLHELAAVTIARMPSSKAAANLTDAYKSHFKSMLAITDEIQSETGAAFTLALVDELPRWMFPEQRRAVISALLLLARDGVPLARLNALAAIDEVILRGNQNTADMRLGLVQEGLELFATHGKELSGNKWQLGILAWIPTGLDRVPCGRRVYAFRRLIKDFRPGTTER